MSQIAVGGSLPEPALAGRFPALRRENIYWTPPGILRSAMLGMGVLGIAGVLAGGFAYNARHALAAYHVGAMSVLGMALASLFLCMFMQLVNTGWNGTIRRQLENIASLVPFAGIMVVLGLGFEVAKGGVLFTWLTDAYVDDYLLKKKSAYLDLGFFAIRGVIYVLVWTILAARMNYYSRMQDQTGDWNWTRKARVTSAWGIIAFAFATAFAAFDWLKSIDFRFFSTMWGVYFFAGGMFGGVGLLILVLATLRRAGKLEGAVTEEHFHDVGKLMFSFTVFWSYIAFSQYFLIWYSNIPEETAYFVERTSGGWKTLFIILCFGHFVLPFLVLLFRAVKRSHNLLTLVALWVIVIHVLDIVFIVRPMVYIGAGAADNPGLAGAWVDVAGVLGVMGIFGFLLLRRIGSGPLVPLNDPRYEEALTHKNYV